MQHLAIAALVLVLSVTPAAAQQIGGRYSVEGTNPDGSAYRGSAEIIAAGGRTCRIMWNVGTTWNGTCLVGERSFAATYRSGNESGMAVYDLQPDGTLRGVWSLGDNRRTGTENLIPAK